MAAPKIYSTGVQIDTSPTGTERITVDTGGPQLTVMPLSALLSLFGPYIESSASTAAIVATAAQMGGSNSIPSPNVTFQLTGSTGGNLTFTTPSVAAMIAAFPGWEIGQSYNFTLSNQNSGNNWTLTAGSGWTLAGGSAVVATDTWRQFVVTLTSLVAITATMVAVGTWS